VPICEIDPWRTQYFENAACPADVFIPTEDSDAWLWNPAHRWIYDKLAVAMSQGLNAAPHGVAPQNYPVFSKPIYNLKGMGVGSRPLASADDYTTAYQPGHMWSTLLEGKHISSDVVLVDGTPQWWRHASGITSGGGTFDCWEVRAEAEPAVEEWCGAWCRQHLKGYTGMLNLESIGGRIIEAHLRFADQWPDLYGPGWVEALVALTPGRMAVRRLARHTATASCSSPRRAATAIRQQTCNAKPPPARRVEPANHVSENLAPGRHAMPPGGFRLAIVNCWDRGAGNAARELLRAHFDSASKSS
jgi:hypothetical protein